jgi:CopG family nickel-responsive transcriptional regulator
MQRVTVTVDDELVDEIDQFMHLRGYQNRSEALRDLARAGLQQVHEEGSGSGECVAALVYVYDHHVRELAKRLADTQHDHHDLSIATMHAHLDHETCLEVALLRGRAADVRHFSAHITSERGVRHGRLVLVPVEVTSEKHAHGERQPHKHTHVRVREAGSR